MTWARWIAVLLLVTAGVATGVASAASNPPIGTRGDAGSGFGHAKPRTIRDGQGTISHIRWASYGAPQATGYGRATYVPPGRCAACGGHTLEATVVAYGLARCHGRTIYEYVGWYFPTRGEHFNRWIGATNLCSGRAHPAPRSLVSPHYCAGTHAIKGSALRASSLVTTDYSCAGALKLLASLETQHHYGHNADYYAPPWYCGSSLRSERTPGVQPFVCRQGDFHRIAFNLSR